MPFAGKTQNRMADNMIGFEVSKLIMGQLLIGGGGGGSNEGGGATALTLEMAYKRKISNYLYYRGTFGYCNYQRVKWNNIEQKNKGFYTKQGVDIVINPDSRTFHFLLGFGGFISNYRETGNGLVKGSYFPNRKWLLTDSPQMAAGIEQAVRFVWDPTKHLSLELSAKIAIPFYLSDSYFNHFYVGGLGRSVYMGDQSETSPIYPGMEFKVYYTFGYQD
jgi:hypothetical protein